MKWGNPPTHQPGVAGGHEGKGAAGAPGQGEQVRGAPRQRCPGERQGTGAGAVLALVLLQGRLKEVRMLTGVNSHMGMLPNSTGSSPQGWVRFTQPPCPAQPNHPPHQCSNCARPLLPTPRLHLQLQSKPGSGCHPCDHHITSSGRDTTTSITASVVWFFFPLMAEQHFFPR